MMGRDALEVLSDACVRIARLEEFTTVFTRRTDIALEHAARRAVGHEVISMVSESEHAELSSAPLSTFEIRSHIRVSGHDSYAETVVDEESGLEETALFEQGGWIIRRSGREEVRVARHDALLPAEVLNPLELATAYRFDSMAEDVVAERAAYAIGCGLRARPAWLFPSSDSCGDAARKVWIDVQSGLLVKSERYDQQGREFDVYQLLELVIPPFAS